MANWIKGAISKPGAFSAKAKAAGKSTSEFAQEKKGAGGKIGKQANLAITLGKLRKHKAAFGGIYEPKKKPLDFPKRGVKFSGPGAPFD